MKSFLIDCSGMGNITVYVVCAENEEQAKLKLKEKLGYLPYKLKVTDLSKVNFLEIINWDDPNYDG